MISKFVLDELDKISKDEGFLNYEMEQESGSQHGDGFLAKMLAVTLIGKRKIGDRIVDNSKLHLMCKVLPENVDRRIFFDSVSFFEREIYVYNKILSIFDKFQCDKNIAFEDRFTEYPKCYATASDLANGEHIIIMENLKSVGYGLWNKTKPIDYETACLYMNALGKFHALSFALRDQQPELFDEISSFEDVLIKAMRRDDTTEKMIIGGFDIGLSLLDQPKEREILQEMKNNAKDDLLRLLDKELTGKVYVLNHGDSWNNNLFYSNGGSSKPQTISLLDWQLTRCASPGLDISYYLMSSTNKRVRERYYDLLKVYHESLSHLMRKLGSDPNKWFTLDDLIDQLKRVGKFGLMIAPCLLQIMVSDPKNIIDMDGMTKESKGMTQFATLDEMASIEFKERLSDAIKDGIRFGWV